MKFRVKKKTAVEIVVSIVSVIVVIVIAISCDVGLNSWFRFHLRNIAIYFEPSTIPAYVKRYPPINYEFDVPDTADNLADEWFYTQVFPDIKPDKKRMEKIKADIPIWRRQSEDFDKVKFEFVKASLNNSWECDIENNSEVKAPLRGKANVLLFYNMESYCTGVIFDKLLLESGNETFDVKAKAYSLYRYSGFNFPGYQKYGASYFKLDKILDNIDETPKLTGFTVGLVNYFRTERCYYKKCCVYDDVWTLAGKTLQSKVLKNNNIEISIGKIIHSEYRSKGQIEIKYVKPYNTFVKYKIIQGKNVFSYPPEHFYLGSKGTFVWEDTFDFSKSARLCVEIKSWVLRETRSFKFDNVK